jgi:SlyX protein
MPETELTARIDRLEMLVSEQEYTIETLNRIVTEQTKDIDRLECTVEQLRRQVGELRKRIPAARPVDEKPPHY